jgi:repressor LexA
LKFVAQAEQYGHKPSIAQVMEALEIGRESSATRSLEPLIERGLIAVEGGGRGRPRRLGLTAQGRELLPLRIPVLGCITAGPLREAIENCDEWVEGLESLLPIKNGDFFLMVDGDSMTGDGIFDGDRVLVRPGVHIGNGEIAAVQVDDSNGTRCATLKHVHFQEDSRMVRLRASNSAYDDLVVPVDEVTIAGAYRGLFRPPKS